MTSSSCVSTHSQTRSSANARRCLPSFRPTAQRASPSSPRKSLCPSAAHRRPTQRPPRHYCLSHGKTSRPALHQVQRRRTTQTVLKEKHQVAFCLAHLLLARAGQTSPPRRQNTRDVTAACASMRVTAACANMSVTASATKFDAVKRLTWATMKLITVCRSVRVRVDRDKDLKLASPPFNVTRRDSNVINNGRIVASTRNRTTTSRPLRRIRATR
jgi:hypothetical protein